MVETATVAEPTPKRSAKPRSTPALERSSRSVLNPEPVRAVEPHAPHVRNMSSEVEPAPRSYHQGNYESSWITRTTIRSLETKWQDAIRKRDPEALDKLLADDFRTTSADGGAASKSQILREVRDNTNTYHSAKASNMVVKMQTPEIAVVTGIAKQKGTKENGEKFSSTIQFTDTWNLRDGQWVCVSSEAERVER